METVAEECFDTVSVLVCTSVPRAVTVTLPHSVTMGELEPDMLGEELMDLDAKADAELVTLAVEDPEARVLREPVLDPDGLMDWLGHVLELTVRRVEAVLEVLTVGVGELDRQLERDCVPLPLLLRETLGEAVGEGMAVALLEPDTDAVVQGVAVGERLPLGEEDMLPVPQAELDREAVRV